MPHRLPTLYDSGSEALYTESRVSPSACLWLSCQLASEYTPDQVTFDVTVGFARLWHRRLG